MAVSPWKPEYPTYYMHASVTTTVLAAFVFIVIHLHLTQIEHHLSFALYAPFTLPHSLPIPPSFLPSPPSSSLPLHLSSSLCGAWLVRPDDESVYEWRELISPEWPLSLCLSPGRIPPALQPGVDWPCGPAPETPLTPHHHHYNQSQAGEVNTNTLCH